MVSEVKVQSSNFAAEYGAGGMNVSGVTKAGSSKFHGEVYDYWRDSKFAANDRSNSITNTPKPKSNVQLSRRQLRRPDRLRRQLHEEPRQAVLLRRLEGQRQQVDSGARFSRTYTQAMRNGDFSELLANRGSNLNSIAQLRIPAGFPGAGDPVPNNDMRPYMTPPASTWRASIRCRTTTTRPTFTTTSTRRSSPRTASTSSRASTGT